MRDARCARNIIPQSLVSLVRMRGWTMGSGPDSQGSHDQTDTRENEDDAE